MPGGSGGDRAIQQQVVVRQFQFHLTGLDHGPGVVHLAGRQIAQAFQAQRAFAAQRAGRRRDVQPHFTGAGHHHAHAVLEQVGADLHAQAFGRGPQRFGGLGRREGHGDGFGAAQGGHHFLVDQIKKGLLGCAHAFSVLPECCMAPSSP